MGFVAYHQPLGTLEPDRRDAITARLQALHQAHGSRPEPSAARAPEPIEDNPFAPAGD